MVRCFVGVFLPEEVKSYIISLQNELGKMELDCKFVEDVNMHISLTFIGEVDDDKVEMMNGALSSLPDKFKKFSVRTGNIKLIPNDKFVRVIALDVVSEDLKELQKEVVKRVDGDVKPPHITLCRVKSSIDRIQADKIKSLVKDNVEFLINSIVLVKSVVTRGGPVYETLAEYMLA